MSTAEIIPTSQIPPRETRWSSVQNTLRVLKVGHSLKLQMTDAESYDTNRSAIYQAARRLGFRVKIQRRGPLKLYITRIAEKEV
jgi:hypothetical protein